MLVIYYFKGIDSDALITGLGNIAVSKGSACSSSSTEPSHVLKGIGLSDNDAFSSLRFSFSKFNTIKEIKFTSAILYDIIQKLNKL